MLKILNRKTNPRTFINYVFSTKVRRKINRIILHHTSSPLDIWQGSASMLHYWNLYKSKGWKAGPHIFIAPNGIWLFTPIDKKAQTSLKGIDKDSIHVEIVGQYFHGPPTNNHICLHAASVVDTLFKKFNLNITDVFNHYGYDKDSNCSPFVNNGWLEEQLDKYKHEIIKAYENSNFPNKAN